MKPAPSSKDWDIFQLLKDLGSEKAVYPTELFSARRAAFLDQLAHHKRTLVATGGGDNMLSAIGSGATRLGVFVASLGTSGTVFTRSERPIVDPDGLIAPFCDSAGAWLPLLCVMNVTGVTEELRACFGLDARGRDDLERRAATVPPGSDGLLFVPYLAGERVPDLPHASGTLLGIRHGRLRPEILWRAALEGTSVSLGQGVARMRRLGLELASVRLVGGGARSPLWCQILADVLGVPAERLAEPESAALGAALQALWTWRREQGDDAALDALVQPFVAPEGPPYEPDEARMATYRALGERFTDAVGRLSSG
jgi:sugar (pentulose or hexulose) kinase